MRRWIIALILVGGFAYCLYAQPGPIQPIITNLTQFVNQTAWRLFYSDGDGDVTELAFGTSGQYLKSNGATSAPSWATPGGGGDLLADGSVPMTSNWDIGNFDITLKSLTGDGTIEGATLTEGGNAVYNSSETPGGELGGTWANPTLDDDALDDQYYDSEADLTGLLDDNYAAVLGADDNYVTDAEKIVIGNTSGTNTGDNTVATSGDAAVDFFGAGVDAVTDATTCTDIEGTGLSITTSTLNCDLEGTELKSTGEGDGSKYLREDGDGTCSWQAVAGGFTSFHLEDADGTEVEITDTKEVKFIESTGIDIDWTDTSDGTDADPFDMTFTISPAAIAGAIGAGEYADDTVNNDDINWGDIDNLGDEGAVTLAATVTVSDDENTDDDQEIVFTTDNATLESDGDFHYSPDTGTVTATEFVGGGAGLTGVTAAVDTTTIDDTTWSDNANATNTWTFNVSGTDHTMIAGNGKMTFSHALAVGTALSIGDADIAEAELEIIDGATCTTTQLNYLNQSTGTTGTNTTNIVFSTSPTLVTPALGTPSALVGTNISGTAANLTSGNVTNATLTTALTVDTGTLTLTANAANNSVLTIGAGASSISGANTGDNTDAETGDSATAFFDAGTIEHEWGGLQADISGYTGLIAITGADTTAEIDSLDELEGQLAGVTRIVSEAVMPVASTDPDVDAAGELSVDTDGGNEPNSVTLRTFMGTDDQAIFSDTLKHFSFTIAEPDALAQSSFIPVLPNRTGFSFIITKISGESDIDDFDFTLKERDGDGANVTTVEAVQLTTNGTGMYYGSVVFADIDHTVIESGHTVGYDNSEDDATYVTVTISGYFLADVD